MPDQRISAGLLMLESCREGNVHDSNQRQGEEDRLHHFGTELTVELKVSHSPTTSGGCSVQPGFFRSLANGLCWRVVSC